MDKKQEKVADYLSKATNLGVQFKARDARGIYLEMAETVISMVLPKDKPPLLSDDRQLSDAGKFEDVPGGEFFEIARRVARAQRKADIKHYEELE